MRRAALVLAALIMCVALASFASCKGTSRAGNTAAPIEATNGDTENTAIKPYNRLMLTRYEEIVDDESIMLCPYVDDEEYGYISTLIAIRIRARIRSYDMPVSTSFRIKSNACGVLSMIIEFFDMQTDELVGRLPLTYDLALGREIQIQDCFDKESDAWRTIIPDMIEAQAKERGMILLNDIMPISDGQLFYTTGSSIAILYRPYEITTLSEPWPEFLIPIKKLKAYIDQSGALKRQLDAADKSGDDEPDAGYKEEEPAPAAENDKSEETSSENGGK